MCTLPKESVDTVEVAARDLNELTVRAIVSHKGKPKQRKTLQFEVEWEPDGDHTWESWETMRNTEAVNKYVANVKNLKYLMVKSSSK